MCYVSSSLLWFSLRLTFTLSWAVVRPTAKQELGSKVLIPVSRVQCMSNSSFIIYSVQDFVLFLD